MRPHLLGLYDNQAGWTDSLAGRTTLPAHFKANGYLVLGSGKVFHGPGRGTRGERAALWDEEAWWGDRAWWDEFARLGDLSALGAKAGRSGIDEEALQGLKNGFQWAAFEGADEDVPDHATVGWAVERLAKDYDQPFFLTCGIFLPHLPWFVPRGPDWQPLESLALPPSRADDLADVPAIALVGEKRALHREVMSRDLQRQAVQAYLAAISCADRQIGRLLDALDASPHAKDTIVVLWSDHGYHLGEKEHWHKQSLWEEATRIPLIFVVPGVTRPGTRCARAVDSLAVFPTLCRAAGLDVPRRRPVPTSLRCSPIPPRPSTPAPSRRTSRATTPCGPSAGATPATATAPRSSTTTTPTRTSGRTLPPGRSSPRSRRAWQRDCQGADIGVRGSRRSEALRGLRAGPRAGARLGRREAPG